MNRQLITASFLYSIALGSAAMAQAVNPAAETAPAPAVALDAGAAGPSLGAESSQFMRGREPGILRASDVIGKDIYGPENEDVGEVSDILLDPQGRVVAFVLEVGGFLGLGGRKVAVDPRAVRLNPLDMTATTGTIEGEGLAASTVEGRETRDQNRISRAIIPDRITLTMPVSHLRTAPEYRDLP